MILAQTMLAFLENRRNIMGLQIREVVSFI